MKQSAEAESRGPLCEKTYAFAVRVVKCCQHLVNRRKEFVLSKQLLRSGTSIGANVEEANGAVSKAEFSAKMSIAYKECRETKYWLRLLTDTGYLDGKSFRSIYADADELGRLLFATIKTSRGTRP
jgi:four helix bundle protein